MKRAAPFAARALGRRPNCRARTSLVDAMATDTRALMPGAPVSSPCAASASTATTSPTTRPMRHAAALLVDARGDGGRCRRSSSPTPQRALARIAGSLQRDRGGKVVAITGSNGKTSVKTLLQSILQLRAAAAYVNPGNRNNEIGLPLAVIDAPDDADFAIYEMGAGKPGDIAYLTDDRAARTWRWSTTSRPRTWSAWAACWAWPRPRARSTTRCPPTAWR